MTQESNPLDPQSVFCEVCLKRVPKAEALISETRDAVAYFCSAGCYERWHGEHPPAPGPRDVQEGAGGRSQSREERVKHLIRQHPQRDEPKADSVERDELPPR
jgi:hypothetical protein